CAEGLSALLHRAESERKFEGIRICRGAPRVSHLFFADDSLILMKARSDYAQELKQILYKYELASGQEINKYKSFILFSPNTDNRIKIQMRSILSIDEEVKNERYLGLPITVGKSKKRSFEYIKNKIWARIQGWQEKLLSKAGKEILVKAVAQAIPTYAMLCFDLTKGLCDEMSSMINRFWRQNISRTRVYCGALLEEVSPIRFARGVYELIDPATRSWDEQLIKDTFWPEDVLRDFDNPNATDWPAWHFDSTENFSVKSAYKLAVHIGDQDLGKDASSSTAADVSSNNDKFIWHKLRQLKLPNKVKIFIWRLAHNSLPVRRNLARRGVKTDTICPVCHRLDEDCGHIFQIQDV
ncbi:hypothetical protein U9M48_021201, partial [Paspalum notatum var. saurae]